MQITLNSQNRKTIDGTSGNDNITLEGIGDKNTVNGLAGNDFIHVGFAAGTSDYTNSTITGGDGDDYLAGFGTGSIIYGNKGKDKIRFDDPVNGATAFGGQDDDQLAIVVQANNVTLSGDAGSDSLEDKTSSTGTILLGGRDADLISVNGTNDTANGNSGNDMIFVSGSGNVALGGMNQDTLNLSSDGHNVMNGSKGNDMLFDNGRAGSLFGGQDNDILTGYNADTTLEGDLGNDLFVVQDQNPNSLAGGLTTITDFVTGTDQVTLGDSGAVSAANNPYAEAKVHGGLSNALAATQGTNGYTFVAGDTDGFLIHSTNGNIDSAVTLAGANSLSSFAATDIKG